MPAGDAYSGLLLLLPLLIPPPSPPPPPAVIQEGTFTNRAGRGGGRDLMGGDLRGHRQQLGSVLQEECEVLRSNSALLPLGFFSLPANHKFSFSADSKKMATTFKMADFLLGLACWCLTFCLSIHFLVKFVNHCVTLPDRS